MHHTLDIEAMARAEALAEPAAPAAVATPPISGAFAAANVFAAVGLALSAIDASGDRRLVAAGLVFALPALVASLVASHGGRPLASYLEVTLGGVAQVFAHGCALLAVSADRTSPLALAGAGLVACAWPAAMISCSRRPADAFGGCAVALVVGGTLALAVGSLALQAPGRDRILAAFELIALGWLAVGGAINAAQPGALMLEGDAGVQLRVLVGLALLVEVALPAAHATVVLAEGAPPPLVAGAWLVVFGWGVALCAGVAGRPA